MSEHQPSSKTIPFHSAVQALDVDDRDRFIMVYDDVWEALKGKTSLSVYMSLKRRVNPDRKYWYGTYNSLAEEAGVSTKTFQRCINELEGIGLVVSTRRFVPRGWDRKDNSKIVYGEKPGKGYEEIGKLYQIRFHMPSGKSDQTGGGKSDQTPLGKSDQTPLGKSDHQTYIPSDIDTQDIDTRPPLAPQGGDDASAVEQGDEPRPRKRTRHEYTPEFEEFWKLWPNHRGTSKFETSKKFARALKAADPDAILEGARRFAADPNLDVAYCPAPTTWLNNRRWEAGPLASRNDRSSWPDPLDALAVAHADRPQTSVKGPQTDAEPDSIPLSTSRAACPACDHVGQRPQLNFRTGLVMEVKCLHSPDDVAGAEQARAVEEGGV